MLKSGDCADCVTTSMGGEHLAPASFSAAVMRSAPFLPSPVWHLAPSCWTRMRVASWNLLHRAGKIRLTWDETSPCGKVLRRSCCPAAAAQHLGRSGLPDAPLHAACEWTAGGLSSLHLADGGEPWHVTGAAEATVSQCLRIFERAARRCGALNEPATLAMHRRSENFLRSPFQGRTIITTRRIVLVERPSQVSTFPDSASGCDGC